MLLLPVGPRQMLPSKRFFRCSNCLAPCLFDASGTKSARVHTQTHTHTHTPRYRLHTRRYASICASGRCPEGHMSGRGGANQRGQDSCNYQPTSVSQSRQCNSCEHRPSSDPVASSKKGAVMSQLRATRGCGGCGGCMYQSSRLSIRFPHPNRVRQPRKLDDQATIDAHPLELCGHLISLRPDGLTEVLQDGRLHLAPSTSTPSLTQRTRPSYPRKSFYAALDYHPIRNPTWWFVSLPVSFSARPLRHAAPCGVKRTNYVLGDAPPHAGHMQVVQAPCPLSK
jgi:hypothetical protein